MSRLTRIQLVRVHYIPRSLEPGILYVSEEFCAAVHLCACGCGAKVSTPLGPTEWKLQEVDQQPTLKPSVGNWQLPCQSHYWINCGRIVWCEKWSAEQIDAGRQAEARRRIEYFDERGATQQGVLRRLWRWFMNIFP